ncbi:MAG: TatD family hydrolase [Oscillospiraceae bacterium]|jgi:TatD DNase family protein|nr:TatD family hydrolase [Oscillospiraceae bacterium]
MIGGIFDSHAHYTDKRFAADRAAVLAALPARGVIAALCCGSDVPDSRAALRLAQQYPFLYAACGIHPHKAQAANEAAYEALAGLLKEKKCVALGEIGLDYHYNFSPRETQRACFLRQLALAKELDLPVVIHDREAHEDTLALLQRLRPRGVVHCYSGSREMAKELLKMDLYLGFGGAVTFKNARRPLEIAAEIPQDRLLLETDAPYMTPEPHRGARCESPHIAFTAQKIARARGMDAQELVEICSENARRCFDLA